MMASLVGGAHALGAGAAPAALPEAQAAQVQFSFLKADGYRVSRLSKPQRLVIDFPHARLAREGLPKPTGAIQSIRVGTRAHGGLRLVLQLREWLPARVRWCASKERPHECLMVSLGAPVATHRGAALESAADTRASDAVPHASDATLRPRDAAPRVPIARPALAVSAAAPEAVRAPHAPRDAERDVIVAVDAGHGGEDPGATGPAGTHEKEVTLAIARALARRIDAEAGMRAVLTRDRDEFVSLRERIHRARVAQADLFVSLHADSVRNSEVSGSSVYVLSERGASNEQARWLAERENAADLKGGVSLADKDSTLRSVLLDLTNAANISASMSAADRVLASLEEVGVVRKARVQQAGFVVLKSPDIPSMLIETAYISNPAEEQRLRTEAHQEQLAQAILAGLRSYFEQNPPPGTRFAHEHAAGASAVLAGASLPATAVTP